MSAFLSRLMSNTSRHVAPQLDDLDPCAFGGGRSDELPEIPLAQAVQVCHDISAKINSWCECEAQGARKCGGCE